MPNTVNSDIVPETVPRPKEAWKAPILTIISSQNTEAKSVSHVFEYPTAPVGPS